MMNINIEALSEDEIVTRLKSGELDADEGYVALQAKLYPFLLSAARHYDQSIAEDVVVDTLARLPTVLDSYKGRGSLRAYLLAVVRAYIFRNRQKSENKFSIEIPDSGVANPQQIYESAQLISEMLAKLTEEERLIITTHLIEGASYRELAETLNISQLSVRKKLHRAMEKMRVLVKEQRIA